MLNPLEHNAIRFWEGTREPGLFVFFPNGNHTKWPNGNPEARITKRTQIAWLMRHFNGSDDMETFFTGEIIQADVDAGHIEVEHRY